MCPRGSCDDRGVSAPLLTPLAAAIMHLPQPERALVVGCGDGEAALLLAREFPSARIRGVDAAADLVRAAQARVGLDPEGRVAFKPATPRHLPFPDQFFDLVAQLGGRPTPAEIVRVLRPGGHFVVVRLGPPDLRARLSERRLPRRLRAHRIEIEQEEERGDGKFWIARIDRHG